MEGASATVDFSLSSEFGLLQLFIVFLLCLKILFSVLELVLGNHNYTLGLHLFCELLVHFFLDNLESFFCFLSDVLHFLLTLRAWLGLSCQSLKFLNLLFSFFDFWDEFDRFTLCFEGLHLILVDRLLGFYRIFLN